MCGIAGLVSAEALEGAVPIEGMTDALRHRGPDGGGYVDLEPGTARPGPAGLRPSSGPARLWLGHRRLSIIDLEGSRQPLSNEDGTVWVTFNGEIFYNYREIRQQLDRRGHHLREKGDSEVLVHLREEHGEAMLEPLVGMFAFGLYDTRRGVLFLARDRFGKKPLYYWERPGLFAFASELEALKRLDGFPLGQADPIAAAQYFRYGCVPGPRTIYPGVASLPAGHYAVIEQGRLRLGEYWRPRGRGEGTGTSRGAPGTSS